MTRSASFRGKIARTVIRLMEWYFRYWEWSMTRFFDALMGIQHRALHWITWSSDRLIGWQKKANWWIDLAMCSNWVTKHLIMIDYTNEFKLTDRLNVYINWLIGSNDQRTHYHMIAGWLTVDRAPTISTIINQCVVPMYPWSTRLRDLLFQYFDIDRPFHPPDLSKW
jgi:hypothetical protein